jgi:hypothetical protein
MRRYLDLCCAAAAMTHWFYVIRTVVKFPDHKFGAFVLINTKMYELIGYLPNYFYKQKSMIDYKTM